jgi:hypothetical protein
MKIHRFSILSVILLCLSVSGKGQQSFNGSISPSATIQNCVAFTLTSNSSPTITFNNGYDYVTGYTVSNFSTIAVKSNVAWNLYLSSTTTNFSNSGIYSSPNTPASILEYGIEGKSTKLVLSATAKLLNSGINGDNNKPGNRFNISFSAKPGYTYGPGTYTISTVYTLTAQ